MFLKSEMYNPGPTWPQLFLLLNYYILQKLIANENEAVPVGGVLANAPTGTGATGWGGTLLQREWKGREGTGQSIRRRRGQQHWKARGRRKLLSERLTAVADDATAQGQMGMKRA